MINLQTIVRELYKLKHPVFVLQGDITIQQWTDFTTDVSNRREVFISEDEPTSLYEVIAAYIAVVTGEITEAHISSQAPIVISMPKEIGLNAINVGGDNVVLHYEMIKDTSVIEKCVSLGSMFSREDTKDCKHYILGSLFNVNKVLTNITN